MRCAVVLFTTMGVACGAKKVARPMTPDYPLATKLCSAKLEGTDIAVAVEVQGGIMLLKKDRHAPRWNVDCARVNEQPKNSVDALKEEEVNDLTAKFLVYDLPAGGPRRGDEPANLAGRDVATQHPAGAGSIVEFASQGGKRMPPALNGRMEAPVDVEGKGYQMPMVNEEARGPAKSEAMTLEVGDEVLVAGVDEKQVWRMALVTITKVKSDRYVVSPTLAKDDIGSHGPAWVYRDGKNRLVGLHMVGSCGGVKPLRD